MSYYSTTLYPSDLTILSTPTWLTDSILNFYYDYLQHEEIPCRFNKEVKSSKQTWKAEHCRFVANGTAFLLLHEEDSFQFARCTDFILDATLCGLLDKEDLLDVWSAVEFDETIKALFFQINDNTNMDRPGGSHWSLLIFEMESKQFYYIDSMRTANLAVAERLANKIGPIIEDLSGQRGSKFNVIKSPTQTNGYDCGVYVLLASVIIGEYIESGYSLANSEIKTALQSFLSPEEVKKFRGTLKTLFQSVMYGSNSSIR